MPHRQAILLISLCATALLLVTRLAAAQPLDSSFAPWDRVEGLTAEQATKIREIFAERRAFMPSGETLCTFYPTSSSFERRYALRAKHLTEVQATTWQIMRGSILTEAQGKQAELVWKSYEQSEEWTELLQCAEPQVSSELCWAACVQALLKYDGVQITQTELAIQTLGTNINRPIGVQELVTAIAASNYGAALNIPFRVLPSLIPRNADASIIRLFGMQWGVLLPFDERHLVLLVGLKWTGPESDPHITQLTIFDPRDGVRKITPAELDAAIPRGKNLIAIAMGTGQFQGPLAPTVNDSLLVRRNGTYSFVAANGVPICDETYDEILFDSFECLLARKGAKWGVLGSDGRFAIPPTFDKATGFGWSVNQRANIAMVQSGGRWKSIDPTGKVVTNDLGAWEAVRRFAVGYAAVKDGLGKWGYIDETGKIVVNARFDEARDFRPLTPAEQSPEACGAFVRLGSQWSLIDASGVAITNNRFRSVDLTLGSPLPASTQNGFGFIDDRGNWLLQPRFEAAGPFSSGMAAARLPGAKFGYVDALWSFAIPPTFESATPFAGNAAVVEYQGRWGVIDRSGAWHIEPEYVGFVMWWHALPILIDDQDRAWYVDCHGTRVMKYGDDQLAGQVGDSRRVDITFISDPPKAEVYMIPVFRWERHKDELLANSDERSRYIIAAAVTNASGSVASKPFEGTYRLLFVWPDGRKDHREIQIQRDGEKTFTGIAK